MDESKLIFNKSIPFLRWLNEMFSFCRTQFFSLAVILSNLLFPLIKEMNKNWVRVDPFCMYHSHF